MQLLLYLNLLCLVFAQLSVFSSYYLQNKWLRAKGEYSELDNLVTTKVYKNIIIEVAFLLITPMPFFVGLEFHEEYPDKGLSFKVPLNNLLNFLGFLYRILYLGRFTLINTPYKNPRS